MTREIALVTAASARALDHDLPPLAAALKRAGAAVTIAEWHDAAVDWARFDLAVIRSTWDYTLRHAEFLAWVVRAGAATRLVNQAAILRWNSDKHYLGELAAAGLPVVPSHFIEPPAGGLGLPGNIQAAAELVVKPCIGAGSRDAQRYRAGEPAIARHVQRLLGAGRSVLVQPYLGRVDREGETALVFFGGRFSHAIRKGPLLRLGQEPTRALFAPEQIAARAPAADELELAQTVVDRVPALLANRGATAGQPDRLPYARVDLLRDGDGRPRLLELELLEPSLFFGVAPGAAERFAAVLLETGAE